MTEDRSVTYLRSRIKTTGKTLREAFARNEGVILGEASIVSRKVHLEPRENDGVVYVYPSRDAGMTFLKLVEKNQAVHIDVFHTSADINIFDLANRIRVTIANYLDLLDEDGIQSGPDREMVTLNLAQRFYLKTAGGEGTALNPQASAIPPGGTLCSHVHIVAKITDRYYGLVFLIIDQVEKAVTFQGNRLRPPNKVIHVIEEEDDGENFPLGVPAAHSSAGAPLEVRVQNHSQVLTAMAQLLGGLEIAEAFLELISPLKTVSLARFGKRYPCMDKIVQDLVLLEYVKKERIGCSLTVSGRELKDYLRHHRKELGIQIRKAIRHIPPTPGITPAGHFGRVKIQPRAYFDKRKITARDPDNWYNPIAVAETVVSAAKRKLLQRSPRFDIREEDLMVYKKRYKAPVDICMVVDCSGSMKGAKLQAVQWVAEYLVLTTRDRVSLVSFQERAAKVVVPFTKSYTNVHRSLLDLEPEGLTPLASGLLTGLGLIRKSRPRNPLLALITDGKPNTPLFSTDPVADAIRVCGEFPRNKIRFVVIGIDPAREFIPTLAEAGKGSFYLVDDIDKSNLVTIMRNERKKSLLSTR